LSERAWDAAPQNVRAKFGGNKRNFVAYSVAEMRGLVNTADVGGTRCVSFGSHEDWQRQKYGVTAETDCTKLAGEEWDRQAAHTETRAAYVARRAPVLRELQLRLKRGK
jgi:hypothetical protein